MVWTSKSSGWPGAIVAARAHDHAHLILGALHHLGIAIGAGVDVDRIVVAIDLLIGGDGDGDPVVLRLAERVALAVAHADNGIGNAVHADLFADGVASQAGRLSMMS